MTALIKTSIWLLAVGMALYAAAIFYAWKFGLTGSKNVFLGSYAIGCLLAGAGAAIGSFSFLRGKWPHLAGLALGIAALVFVGVTVGMFYGMLNY